MAIAHVSQYRIKNAFLLGLTLLLVACGSGGGDKAPDTTPNTLTFAPITEAALSVEKTSSAVTVTGIDKAVPISIVGGTYSIGGGAFTATAGTISSGQSVAVKVTSSTKTNTAVTATLSVGGAKGTFSVTTAPDITPDIFSFTAVTGAEPASANTATVTVAGVDIAVPISVTNSQYKIGSGDYTSAPGTVSAGQVVTVKVIASTSLTTAVNALVTIGGVPVTYSVTTLADVTAPTAQILFPPPVSMTEGASIVVRGSAHDDYSTITSVKVNGVTATSSDNFANWQAIVPLTAATTTNLIVTTEDGVANNAVNAAQVAIKQAVITGAFPDADNGFLSIEGIAIDRIDGRNRLLAVATSDGALIKSVDLATGKRTVFADFSSTVISRLRSLVINPSNKHLYAADTLSPGNLVDIDLANSTQYQIHSSDLLVSAASLVLNTSGSNTKIVSVNYVDGAMTVTTPTFTSFSVFSDSAQNKPDALNPIHEAYSMAFDKNHSRYLITDSTINTIFSVDPVTGARTVFSSNSVGIGDAFSPISVGLIRSIAIDENKQKAIVIESKSGKIFTVDLVSGNRTLVAQITIGSNPSKYLNSIAIDDISGSIYVADNRLKGIISIDLVTGQQVVFSKSATEP